ncbi:MAG: hypothetical protein ACXADS_00765 [Candidatus Thorarchaeota archaeon]
MAALLSPSPGPAHLIGETSPLEFVPDEDPFECRVKDDRTFTLYVSAPSSTSHGEAAAWVSKTWHLLNHISECVASSTKESELVWVDLLGDFPNKRLRKARLRFEQLHKEGGLTSEQYRILRRIENKIQFLDLSDDVDRFLSGESELDLNRIKSELGVPYDGYSIVIVDGWSELIRFVPSRRKHLLKVLECALLDSLPKSDTNIIWTDSGVPHSKMNPLYQRRCFRPLPYDSPRRAQLDEVIWNLPLAPRVFGWQTPRRVDIRVIVQDTPTDVQPWSTTVRVPHLRDWARVFRGVSKREKTVDPSEIVRNAKRQAPMYGRLVTLSSIHVDVASLTDKRVIEIQGEACTLAPSLLRRRADATIETQETKEESPWVIAVSPTKTTGQSLTLADRLRLTPNRPPPSPNRSKKQYHSLSRITRGWEYGSIPQPEDHTDCQQGVVRSPPLFKSTESTHIDSFQTREMEVRRLLHAAQFLTTRLSLLSDLAVCCRNQVTMCKDALSGPITEKSLLEALVEVRRHILRSTNILETWNLLRQTRQSITEVLNSDNRLAAWRAMDENDDVLFLYGNNLFLAVYAVAEEILDDTLSPAIIDLWSAVAEWQLYQMGFRPDDVPEHQSISRYDFQAIYSNLGWRAKQMSNIPQPRKPRLLERFGQVIQKDTEDEVSTWIILPEKVQGRMLGGMIEGRRTSVLMHGWYRCEIDPEHLGDSAREVLQRESWDREPIVIVDVSGHDVLFTKSLEEEDSGWVLVGVLEYGNPPRGKDLPVRWVRLSEPSPEVFLSVHGFVPSEQPPDLETSVNRVLKQATEWSGVVEEVTCHLTIDQKKEIYRIDLRQGSRTIAKKETPSTDEVFRFLRSPKRTGKYLETKDGTLLKWDPLQDVEYDGVVVKRKDERTEWMSLSVLRPLIHRHSYFPDSYVVPATCQDLLNIVHGVDVTLRVNVDQKLKGLGVKKYLNVRLEGVSEGVRLSGLESEMMGIYDVALLAECEQLVDVDSGTIHEVVIDAKSLLNLRVVHLLDEYPRLSSAIIGVIEDLDDIELEEEDVEEEVEPWGPELSLVEVNADHSMRRRILDVVALLANVEDEEEVYYITVLSIPSEIAEMQTIAYELIREEVKIALGAKRVTDDVMEKLMEEVCNALEEKGVMVGYY